MILYILAFITSIYIVGSIYYCISLQQEEIEVNKKYIINSNYGEKYFIIDANGKIYKFDRCLWTFHFDNKNLWEKIIEGKTYRVTFYGITIKDFNIIPNIIDIDK